MVVVMSVDAILQGLDPDQAAIAQAIGGPVVVIAGAGTGKTRALTHRIAYAVATKQVQATNVLALTFTTKAAGEMRSRLAQLGVQGVQARTFHSAALRQARFFWPRVTDSALPPVTEKTLPMVAEAARRVGVLQDTARLRDLASEIGWAKVCNVRADDYAALAAEAGRSVSGVSPEQVGNVLTTYEQVKHRAGVIDMDDILLVTLGLLTEHPNVAEQVRATYRHLLVDEYQDVSPIQHTLLKAWLGGGDDLLVVGDPAQSIHAFAGANVRFLLGFGSEFPRSRRFELTRNYRSSGAVVAYANALATRSQGRVKAVTLRTNSELGPRVTQVRCADAQTEIESLVDWLKQRHDAGLAWEDIAVLYRINAQSVAVEAALAQVGVPYTVRGAERFYDRPEVKTALAAWRGLAASRPNDSGQANLRDALTGLGWTPQPPEGQGRQRERWESWQALAQMIDNMPPDQTTAQIMREVEKLVDEQHAPSGPGVVLATLHASKGLEFAAVAIIGAQEGLVPFALANTDEQLAEENRLLYVGATRARRWLRVSWDASRRRPSRFLEIQGAPEAKRQSEQKPKRQLRTCRVCGKPMLVGTDIKLGRHIGCPSSYDEALLDSLKAWRLQRSRADEVPAFVVFSDATLIAIAEATPSTPQALLDISGVGPSKLERYSKEVLAIVNRAS